MEFNDTGEVEPPMLWDAFKAVMRENTIARTSRIQKLQQENSKEIHAPETKTLGGGWKSF